MLYEREKERSVEGLKKGGHWDLFSTGFHLGSSTAFVAKTSCSLESNCFLKALNYRAARKCDEGERERK
jgi:hypothetical protein